MDTAVISATAAVSALAIPGLIWTGRKTWRMVHKVEEFLEDYNGTPARPGVPGRKGVMERLADQDTQLTFIQHELSMNSGQSLKDAVVRIDNTVMEIDKAVRGAQSVSK